MTNELPKKTLLVERADVTAAAFLAINVIDAPDVSDELRQQAQYVHEAMKHWLLYGIPSGGRTVRLEPAGFRWQGHYVNLVEEYLMVLLQRPRLGVQPSAGRARV